jgi:hypothetical protein
LTATCCCPSSSPPLGLDHHHDRLHQDGTVALHVEHALELHHRQVFLAHAHHLAGATDVAPSEDELHALLHTVIARLMKMRTRQGVPIEEMGHTWLADPNADGDEARTLRPLQAAAITHRIAFGLRAGQKVMALRGAMAARTW